MISQQKAKRIAYGIVHDAIVVENCKPGPGWNEEEAARIEYLVGKILVELKKKSL